MRPRILLILLTILSPMLHANETVVLLHGLARRPASMAKMAAALDAEGYHVVNLAYPSRQQAVETLAESIRQQIRIQTKDATTVHCVTHSLGGILVRQIQQTNPLPNLGRVVMLAPPNRGSEVVDRIGHWKVFNWINGPAGQQLGTAPDGLIAGLGPVDFECGVLTGDRSINWINSTMIPGPDDGKVSIQSAKVEGMTDYKVLHTTHPMIMKKPAVIEEVIHFLQHGSFKPGH